MQDKLFFSPREVRRMVDSHIAGMEENNSASAYCNRGITGSEFMNCYASAFRFVEREFRALDDDADMNPETKFMNMYTLLKGCENYLASESESWLGRKTHLAKTPSLTALPMVQTLLSCMEAQGNLDPNDSLQENPSFNLAVAEAARLCEQADRKALGMKYRVAGMISASWHSVKRVASYAVNVDLQPKDEITYRIGQNVVPAASKDEPPVTIGDIEIPNGEYREYVYVYTAQQELDNAGI